MNAVNESGGDLVAKRFPNAVAEPVRLQVDAKRCSCSRDSTHPDRPSTASEYTLTMQGGPMTGDEVTEFDANRYAAVEVPPRRHFAPLLERWQRDPRP